jgi:enamine deaminase RidA (YjgF/YER057c/UK114 family)
VTPLPDKGQNVTDRKKHNNPDSVHPPTGYTHVVEVQPGRVAYISGQVALNKAGELVGEGDIVAQTRQVFENIGSALDALGADFSDVVKLNYYAVDVARLAEIRAVRNEFLKTPPPASTFVVVKGLVRPELLIEIEATVALPS